jgi:hypothetical protein
VDPHDVPSTTAEPVSTHSRLPVVHEVIPAWHGLAGVQARFAVQATHCPPLQTWSAPQAVPFASAVPVSTQVWLPVAHEVTPAWHGFAGVQAALAVQATHCPPLHTRSAPQVVPFASAVPFTQTEVPLEQEVAPAWHSVSGCVVQVWFAAQATHDPALQTWSVPQIVPFGFAGPFTHCEVPVEHSVTPPWQSWSGCAVQAFPAVQDTHVPALHTWLGPQEVPFATARPSTHTEVPVPQLVVPA